MDKAQICAVLELRVLPRQLASQHGFQPVMIRLQSLTESVPVFICCLGEEWSIIRRVLSV